MMLKNKHEDMWSRFDSLIAAYLNEAVEQKYSQQIVERVN